MNITELLVTAYDGDQPVLIVDLAPKIITTVMTNIDGAGEAQVAAASVTSVRAVQIFAAVNELLVGLVPTGEM